MAHVVNLSNVDVMKNITKIAVVENATSIWEYDPSREDNRILGGSLEVIAAIRTLAIKVCTTFNLTRLILFKKSHIIFRFRHPDSVLKNSRAPRYVVGFLRHWQFPSTVTFGGELPLKCLIKLIGSARYLLCFSISFNILILWTSSLLVYFYRPRMKYLALSQRFNEKIVS